MQALLIGVAIVLLTGATQALFLSTMGVTPDADIRGNANLFALSLLLGASVGGGALQAARAWTGASSRWGPIPLSTATRWLLGGAALYALMDLAALLAGRPPIPTLWQQAGQDANPLLLIVALVVVAPLFEEGLFRGWLQDALQRWMRPAFAAALLACVFVLAHSPTDAVELAQGAVYATLFAAARLRTGTLRVSALLHALANARVLAWVYLSA